MRRASAGTARAGTAGAAVAGVAVVSLMILGGCTSADPAGNPERTTSSAPVVLPGAPGDIPEVAGPAEVAELDAEQAEPSEAGIRYIRMMIPHHQQALTMTALAPTRAKNAQVRALAERIGGAQEAEIGMMQAWLERNELPRVSDPHVDAQHKRRMGMATPEQLDRLEASSGTRFDRLFLTLMSRHHEGAVSMAENVLEEGTDPQVRSMAKDVIASQRDEIAVMRELAENLGR
ncbi:DUF305 domain-containing protein [Haloactinomyces albus]|uniref:Uncharacterized protein (DUF305 family) n=1 Tax=Haloactinomyces albus TaxID=1352928 RepID=A0AAE4CLZ1_9ACTN|nr:DUF305 domain-containing protein [Haloactinomyces albus]MDR7300447.1 uncharacterized protein (DUF305 family) [Haloactinomyces albus]